MDDREITSHIYYWVAVVFTNSTLLAQNWQFHLASHNPQISIDQQLKDTDSIDVFSIQAPLHLNAPSTTFQHDQRRGILDLCIRCGRFFSHYVPCNLDSDLSPAYFLHKRGSFQ